MNEDNPSGRPDKRSSVRATAHQGLPSLALLIVIVGVLALAAAAFVFSYAGVRDIARAAGIQAGLARFYPAVPDAVVVTACAAALALRGARWSARWLVWLSIIAIVALVGAADAVHAMAIKLPRRPAEGAVAVLPWLLLLLGFRLWLSLLRHARKGQALPANAALAKPAADPAMTHSAASSPLAPGAVAATPIVRPVVEAPASPGPASDDAPGVSSRDGSATSVGKPNSDILRGLGLVPPDPEEPGQESAPDAPFEAYEGADPGPGPDLAIDAEPGPDDPASDESHGIASVGDEIGTERHRLIGESRGDGHSMVPLTADSAADDQESEPATPVWRLIALAPEASVNKHAHRAGEQPGVDPGESGSAQPKPEAFATAAGSATEPAAEPETTQPHGVEPGAAEREPARSAAPAPGVPLAGTRVAGAAPLAVLTRDVPEGAGDPGQPPGPAAARSGRDQIQIGLVAMVDATGRAEIVFDGRLTAQTVECAAPGRLEVKVTGAETHREVRVALRFGCQGQPGWSPYEPATTSSDGTAELELSDVAVGEYEARILAWTPDASVEPTAAELGMLSIRYWPNVTKC